MSTSCLHQSLLGERRRKPWQAGSSWEYASVSTTTPQSTLPSSWRFTSRQPINSGPTTSAGRQKKLWGRAGKSWVMGAVAMGVAVGLSSVLTTVKLL